LAGDLYAGTYHHPAPVGSGFHSVQVKDTYANEALAFVSAYAAKSALFARRVLP
jgi:hypothetical protein